MTDFINGACWQANSAVSELQWQSQMTSSGNALRYSQVKEVNTLLDTSRFHICLPLDGIEKFLLQGESLSLCQDEYLVLNYQKEARGIGKFAQPVKGMCILLCPQTIAEVYQAFTHTPEQLLIQQPFTLPWQRHEFLVKPYSLKENALGQHLQRLKHKILGNSQQLLIDWDEFYYGIAEAFLETHWQINRHLKEISCKKSHTSREIYRRVSRAHNFILDEFSQSLSLEDIAKEALLSPYHFTRLYKKIYGISPYQHILQQRIISAKEMLNRGLSPTEVALELSFSDRRAFAKVFKRYTGFAPSEYVEN